MKSIVQSLIEKEKIESIRSPKYIFICLLKNKEKYINKAIVIASTLFFKSIL